VPLITELDESEIHARASKLNQEIGSNSNAGSNANPVQYLELENYEEESDSDEFFGGESNKKRLIELIQPSELETNCEKKFETVSEKDGKSSISFGDYNSIPILLNGVKFISRATAEEALKPFQKLKPATVHSNSQQNVSLHTNNTTNAIDSRLQFTEKEFDILASLPKKECMRFV
jgi:hypothetical protein